MKEEPVFASLDEYKARYGEPEDPARASVLLADASALLLSSYEGYYGEPYAAGSHAVFDRASAAVCCSVVHRAVSVPAALDGVTQFSQSAGGMSASVSYANATGDLYLGKSDLARLGLSGQSVGCVMPLMGGGVPCS